MDTDIDTCENENKEYCVFNRTSNDFTKLHAYDGGNLHILEEWMENSDFTRNIYKILTDIYNEKNKEDNYDYKFIILIDGRPYTFEYLGGGGGNQVFNIKNTDYILKVGLDKGHTHSSEITNCFTQSCNKDLMNILINRYLSLIHKFCGNQEYGFGFVYEENGMIQKAPFVRSQTKIPLTNAPYTLFLSKKLDFGNNTDDSLENGKYYEMHKLGYIKDIIPTYEIQNIIIQYLCHIRHLHQLGIIHRDIWHRNVFFKYHETPIDIVLNFTLREGQNINEHQSYNCMIKTQIEVFISDFDRSVFVNYVNFNSTSDYDYSTYETNQFFEYIQWTETWTETELLFIYMILYLLSNPFDPSYHKISQPYYTGEILYRTNPTTLYWNNDMIRDDFDEWFLDYIMIKQDNLRFEERSNGVYLTNIIYYNNNKTYKILRNALYNVENIYEFLYNINLKYGINNTIIPNPVQYMKLPFRIEGKEHLLLYRGFIHSFPFDKITRRTNLFFGNESPSQYDIHSQENVLNNIPLRRNDIFDEYNNCNYNGIICDKVNNNKNPNLYQMILENDYYDHPNVFDNCEVSFETRNYETCTLYTHNQPIRPIDFIKQLVENNNLQQLSTNKTYIFINGGFYNKAIGQPETPILAKGIDNVSYGVNQNNKNDTCMKILGITGTKYLAIQNDGKIYFRENGYDYNNESQYTFVFPVAKFHGTQEVNFDGEDFVPLEKKIDELNQYIQKQNNYRRQHGQNILTTNNLCPEHLSNPNPRLILFLEYNGIIDDVSDREPDKIHITNYGGRQIQSEGVRIVDILKNMNLNDNKTYIMCNLDGGYSANIFYYIHMTENEFDEKMFVKENIDQEREHTHYLMFEFDNNSTSITLPMLVDVDSFGRLVN